MDCSYCLHWSTLEEEWGYGSGRYDGVCGCWDKAIPRNLTTDHRMCLDFIPSKYFGEDNGAGSLFEPRTAEEIAVDRLNEFLRHKPDMQIGVLYHYFSHVPASAEFLMRLDEPDV